MRMFFPGNTGKFHFQIQIANIHQNIMIQYQVSGIALLLICALHAVALPQNASLVVYQQEDQHSSSYPALFRRDSSVSADVCRALGKGIDTLTSICDYSIKYPTGAKIKYCSANGFRVDDCKTKQGFNYPCVSKGVCKGWTCVPGTVATTVDVPCDLVISFEKRRVCSDNVYTIAERAKSACTCWAKIEEFLTSKDSDLANSDAADEAASRALSKFVDVTSCVVSSAFSENNNKDEVMGPVNQLSGQLIILPEINQSLYLDLISRIAGCIFGACDPLFLLVKTYFKDSLTALKNGFKDALKMWLLPMEQVGTFLDSFKQALASARTFNLNSVKQCVVQRTKSSAVITDLQKLIKDVDAFITANEQVQKLITMGKKVPDMIDSFMSIMDSIVDSTTPIKAAINALKSSPKLETLFSNVLQFPSEVSKISKIVTQADQIVGNMVKTVTTLDQRTRNIFDESGAGDCFNTDALSVISLNMKLLHDSVVNYQVRVFDIYPRIATYNRWSRVSFDVPCTRQGSTCWKFDKVEQCADFPIVEACRLDDKLALPNHHIPYIQIKFD